MTLVRWIVAAFLAALVVVVAVKSMKPKPVEPLSVQSTKVSRATITRTVSGAGKLQPLRKVNVSSNITGTLLDLKVGIGSEVKKGQYLGQIDTTLYNAKLSQQKAATSGAAADVNRARTNLDKLKRTLERTEELADRGAIGQSELEDARSAVRGAEAELSAAESRAAQQSAGLQEAKSSVAWATLTAPVDGTVIDVKHLVGERIRGSDFSEDVVLVLASLTEMQVRIEVGEHDVVYIKPGQEATIEVDALPDLELKGTVIDNGRDAIVKNAGTDNEVTTFPVWVTLPNPPAEVLSGMSAQVRINTETKKDVIAVPIQAVTVRPPDFGGPGGPGGPGGGEGQKVAEAAAKPGDKPAGDKPAGDKAAGDKPADTAGDKPAGDKPADTAGDKPAGDKPADAAGDKPKDDKAGDKPKEGGGGMGFKMDKVVFVVKDGKVSRRKVMTGLSSEAMVEITGGLEEGEDIVEGPYRILARELKDGDPVQVEEMGGPGGPGGRRGGPGGGRR